MALIKCKECGNEVSSKAAACPKCGAKVPKGISLGSVIGVVVSVALVYSCINIMEGTADIMIKEQDARKAAAERLIDRNEFERLVTGRKAEDLLTLVGTPSSTQQNGNMRYWYYKGVTRDPVTGKADYSTQVIIEGSTVVRVNF